MVSLADGSVLVIDGAATKGTATIVWRVTGDVVEQMATIDEPLRTPSAWQEPDGDVSIVGMSCEGLVNEDDTPACPRASLARAVISGEESVTVAPTGATTSSDIGFDAGPVGDDGLVIAGFDFDDGEWHVWLPAGPTAISDGGPVGWVAVCATDDGTFLVPKDIGPDSTDREVSEVLDGRLASRGSFDVLDAQAAGLASCASDSTVDFNVIAGGVAHRYRASIDPVTSPVEAKAESAIEGASLVEVDGRNFAWQLGDAEAEWRLLEERDSEWVTVGSVQSVEMPRRLGVSGDTIAVVIWSDGSNIIEAL